MTWIQKPVNAPTREEINQLNQSIDKIDPNVKCVKMEYQDGTEEVINDAAIVIRSMKDDIGMEFVNGTDQKYQDMIVQFREKTHDPFVKESKENNNKYRKKRKVIIWEIILVLYIIGVVVLFAFCGYMYGYVEGYDAGGDFVMSLITERTGK